MSMLVRKGTMLHRNPSRRSAGRRSSKESIRKQRNRDIVGTGSVSGKPAQKSLDISSPGLPRRSVGDDGLRFPNPQQRRDSSVHLIPNPFLESHHRYPNGIQAEFEGSPRNSSCTSQLSGEERRDLFRYSKFLYESHGEYVSFMSQLREAREDSQNGCEYAKQFFSIFFKSAFGTVFLLVVSILPLSMACMGVRNLEECPLEPNLPVYFLVAGIFGLLEIIWLFYSQVKSRKYAEFDLSFFEEGSLSGRWTVDLAKWGFNIFLLGLFILGNVLTLQLIGSNGQGPPAYMPTLQRPRGWCSRGLYVFALAHLYLIYALALFLLLTWLTSFTFSTIQIHRRKLNKNAGGSSTLRRTSSTRITRTNYV